jgi:hypothetical protein
VSSGRFLTTHFVPRDCGLSWVPRRWKRIFSADCAVLFLRSELVRRRIPSSSPPMPNLSVPALRSFPTRAAGASLGPSYRALVVQFDTDRSNTGIFRGTQRRKIERAEDSKSLRPDHMTFPKTSEESKWNRSSGELSRRANERFTCHPKKCDSPDWR